MAKNDFSFKRDYRRIKWQATLWVNVLRAAFAGPIWVIFMAFAGDMPFPQVLVYLLFPALYLVGFLPLGLGASFLSSVGVPVVGWLSFAVALMIMVGDPFVFVLHKAKPEFVPVKTFNVINFTLILFVLDEGDDPIL